jgi:hypothetical protein
MARTINHTALATGACVLLAVASCARLPGGAVPSSDHEPGAQGLSFTIRTAGTSFGGRASRPSSIPTQLLGGVLRVDFPSAVDPSGTHRALPGFYVLVNTAAKTTTVVMPASKQYWETRFDSAGVPRAPSSTAISDIDVSAKALGSGGTVNGYATKRYRITTRYTETPSGTTGGEARKKVHVVEDVWVADVWKDVPDPMQAYLRVSPPSGMVGDLVERQAKARRKLFKGLPIRTMWQLTQTFDGGAQASRALTIDVLDLKRAELDRAAFRVPDGYIRFDLAARMNAVDLLLKGAKDARKESSTGRKTP